MTALRLGIGFRQGDVPLLQGHQTGVYAAVGVSFWPRRASPDRRLAVGIRLDALALHYTVSDSRMEGGISPPQTKTLPAVDALAELALSVSTAVDVVAALGIEAAVSETPLKTFDIDPVTMTKTLHEAGTIPALHGLAEMGIRISF
jgi:hypothetical protein